mmetsp:Transcript_9022/g.23677  ORF Transcript_9022/g.23677 Transcript_9022/m.23677 type:complete len:326 (-) Transcript_9022:975-1952(-)
MRHRTKASTRYHGCVLFQSAAQFVLGRHDPVCLARLELFLGELYRYAPKPRFQHDHITFLQQADGTSDRCLRTHVSDHDAVRAPAEATIRDECDRLSEPCAHDRSRWRQHFAHARSAPWAFVADDDNIVWYNFACKDGIERFLLGIEHACRSPVLFNFFSAELYDSSFWCKVSVQHENVLPGRCQRLLDGQNDAFALVSKRQIWGILYIFSNCFARNSHAITVDEAFCKQVLEHSWDPPSLLEVRHNEAPKRLKITNQRNTVGNGVEVIDAEIDFRFVSQCQQVQHSIGGPAERHHDHNPIFKRFSSSDVSRSNATLHAREQSRH